MTFIPPSVNADLEGYQPVAANVTVNKEADMDMVGQQEVGGRRRRTKTPSIVWAMSRAFGGTFIVAGFFKLANDTLAFVSPQILK